MARIAGITIEKDIYGNARFARIDLKKYGQNLESFFSELGIEKEVFYYDPKFVEKIRRSEKQITSGKVHKIDIKNLWK